MKLSKVFFAIPLAALMMSACAKKDDNYAEKFGVNAMNARGVDTDKIADADAAEKEAGLAEFDVIEMTKVSAGTQQQVRAILIVNNKQIPVTTTHGSQLQVSRGSVIVDGFTLVYNAVCGNLSCNPIYVTVESYRQGQTVPVSQLGLRKYFDIKDTDKLDRYQKFTKDQARLIIRGSVFAASDMNDTAVMVGYLNQNLADYVPSH